MRIRPGVRGNSFTYNALPFYRPTMQEILVLYYSHRGSVRALAEVIGRGIDSVPGAAARLVNRTTHLRGLRGYRGRHPGEWRPVCGDVGSEECIGLALGSPRASATCRRQ